MLNKNENSEITKEDRLKLASRFLEIKEEPIRQGIIWLTQTLNQK